jgi:hypothetical protein
MSFNPGKEWSKESDELFIHKSGTRIAKTTYQGAQGWFLMPVDLDVPVMPFPATEAGREQAFEAFAKGALKKKPAKKVEEKKGKKGKPIKLKGTEDDENDPDAEPAPAKDDEAPPEADDDAEKDDEDEEDEEEDDEP